SCCSTCSGKVDSVSDLENLWLTNASFWPTTPARWLSFAAFPRWNACSEHCNVAELNAQRFFRARPIQSQRNSHALRGRGQSCTEHFALVQLDRRGWNRLSIS